MITLSLCMIVKNESDVLGRCLSCTKDIADEIIIVDTGSTDNTKEIAQGFTDKVYDFEWCDDFAAARNFSFSKASMEYTMWLDADDVIDEKNRALLLKLKNELSPSTDMVFLKYDVAFDPQGRPTLSYYRERIFRTALHYRFIGEIHEVIPQSGVVEYKEITVQHRKLHPTESGRNLRIFQKMLSDGKKLDPRQKFYYARELMYTGDYTAAVRQFNEFLDEGQGWIENNINACKDLAQCYARLGEDTSALQSLLRSFCYDVPRAELCCDIGKYFFDREQYRTAVFWYETAASRTPDEHNGGFCLPDCYGYIPYMQLCVCYDRMGDRKRAAQYNEKAGLIKPDDKNYLYNRAYFQDNTGGSE